MAAEMRNAFAWEDRRDCVHTADRWCALAGPSFVAASGVDFASEKEAENMAHRRPMPIWVSRGMRAAGYRRTAEPKPGDVGIVASGEMLACAIRGSLGWLFRTEAGVTCFGPHARVLAAWSVR